MVLARRRGGFWVFAFDDIVVSVEGMMNIGLNGYAIEYTYQ